MLQASGALTPGGCPEEVNLSDPGAVESIHRAYLRAGALGVTTNTFGANRAKLSEYGMSGRVDEANRAAVAAARRAAGERGLVLGSVGPTGQARGRIRHLRTPRRRVGDPLRRAGVGAGQKVGVVGIGGLGHMAVKFARAFGARVVVFTTSPGKRDDALRLGAHEVVLSRNPEEMARHAGSFHFVLDAVSAEHDVNAYLNLLRRDGTMTLVGAPEKPLSVSAFALLFGRHRLAGSLIGGIPETQEMLDFCGAHGITADVEVIPIQRVNEAYERLVKADVKYRFSIDMASLRSE
jgi:hypothetical protein